MSHIVFLPYEKGGIYINLSKATVSQSSGCGRIEFQLSDPEIDELVYGDEPNLTYPLSWNKDHHNFSEYINSLPLVTEAVETEEPWKYWCEIDEDGKALEMW